MKNIRLVTKHDNTTLSIRLIVHVPRTIMYVFTFSVCFDYFFLEDGQVEHVCYSFSVLLYFFSKHSLSTITATTFAKRNIWTCIPPFYFFFHCTGRSDELSHFTYLYSIKGFSLILGYDFFFVCPLLVLFLTNYV